MLNRVEICVNITQIFFNSSYTFFLSIVLRSLRFLCFATSGLHANSTVKKKLQYTPRLRKYKWQTIS